MSAKKNPVSAASGASTSTLSAPGLSLVHAKAFADFDNLPDSAGVPVPVTAAVLTASVVTVWRRIKDGTLDVVRVGGITRVTVGSIRRAMAGGIKPNQKRIADATAASLAARLKSAAAA